MRTALAAWLLAVAAAPAQTGAALHALVARYEAFGFRGAVLVAKGAKALLERGYGGDAADQFFEIASITKSFTAAAILKLRDQQRLGLDDPIAMHLPGVPEHSRAITIRHLLSHTSGVPGSNTKGRGDDLEDAVRDFLGDGPVRAPGSQWEYWNGGFALLAGVVERCSGRRFEDYLRQELFVPAGMTDSGFTGCDWLDAARAAAADGRTALEHPYGSYGFQYKGMGGLVTTVGDLRKWDRALAAGTVLAPATQKEMFAPVIAARGAQQYALGWFVWEDGGVHRQQHGGSVRGFLSDFRRLPERDACIAVLHNGHDRIVPYVVENLEDLLLGREPRHVLPPEVPTVAAAALRRCEGTFRRVDGLEVTIRADGERLLADSADEKALIALVGVRGDGLQGPLVLRATAADTFVHFAWYGSCQLAFTGKKQATRFEVGGKAWVRR
ncbi:MAG: serine hydrolase domain-containing protein [Planctomycetota bacterium]